MRAGGDKGVAFVELSRSRARGVVGSASIGVPAVGALGAHEVRGVQAAQERLPGLRHRTGREDAGPAGNIS